jgi:hypothetical protein
VTGLFQIPLNRFESVKFAVDDDGDRLIFVGDGLIAGRKVNDAQPGMTQRHPAVRRNPLTLRIRAAVMKAASDGSNYASRDRLAARK